MAYDGDGKGPGFVILWGLVGAAFMAVVTWAGVAGAIPWWAAAGFDVALSGFLCWRFLTAKWA